MTFDISVTYVSLLNSEEDWKEINEFRDKLFVA